MQNKKTVIFLGLVSLLVGGVFAVQFCIKDTPPDEPKRMQPLTQLPKKQEKVQEPEVQVIQPITTPGTVVSGTLGEITALRAGLESQQLVYKLRELNIKIDDMQQKPVSQMIHQTVTIPDKQEQKGVQAVILSVQGIESLLSASVLTQRGIIIVKTGDTLPGLGRVVSISRTSVRVRQTSGSEILLPWK